MTNNWKIIGSYKIPSGLKNKVLLDHGSRKHWWQLNLCPKNLSVHKIHLNLWPRSSLWFGFDQNILLTILDNPFSSWSDFFPEIQYLCLAISSFVICFSELLMKLAKCCGSFNFVTSPHTLTSGCKQCLKILFLKCLCM